MGRTLRIALRTLLRRPSFTVVTVLTLALGIGATTAIFTVVNAVVLEPLPYPGSERLVQVEHAVPLSNAEWRWGVSEAGFFAIREGSRTLEDVAVHSSGGGVLAGDDVAARVNVGPVSANLFEVLGGRAIAGRLLRWEDNEPGAAPVVVLSEELWRGRFEGDAGIVGSMLELDGQPREVVGIVAAGFDVPGGDTDLWAAVSISPDNRPVNWHRFAAIGRLRTGADAAAVESDVDRLIAEWPERLPDAYADGFVERTGFRAVVTPLREHVVGDIRSALWVLLGAVGIVLLIGCVNVANLYVVRIEAGRKESALRIALGASRGDLARKWLSESLLLGAAAAGVGLLLAWWGIAALVAAGPEIPRLEEIALGGRSAAFTAGVALLVSLVFGLLPVLRSGVPFGWLREGTGLTTSRERTLVRRGLVVFEIALALMLLTGAGLMLRTFQNLRSVDPGFEAEGALTLSISLPWRHYTGYEEVAAFQRQLSERVGALPGVAAVGATTHLPLGSASGCAILFTDDPAAQANLEHCFATPVLATPGFFAALGTTVTGEPPTWLDMEARRGGVVVTRAFADQVWPGQDPIGRSIRGNGRAEPYYRVVGVAEDLWANGLDQAPVPQVYFPMLPLEGAPLWMPPRAMSVVVRAASGDPARLADAVRSVVRELDTGVALADVRPMTEVVAGSMRRTSFAMLLLGIAAAVALALGVIGLYGVIAYVVEQRRPEIGIRIALGARRGEVQGMIVREAGILAGLGVLVGAAASLVTSGVLASQLYGVDPRDPITLVGVSLVLGAVALAAAYFPARRAASVDPMGVLRGE